MLTKETAALRINSALGQTEASADRLTVDIARLMTEMATARAETEAGFGTGQGAVLALAKAQEQLAHVSGNIARVHAELLKVNRDVRMAPDRDGDCPKNPATLAELRAA